MKCRVVKRLSLAHPSIPLQFRHLSNKPDPQLSYAARIPQGSQRGYASLHKLKVESHVNSKSPRTNQSGGCTRCFSPLCICKLSQYWTSRKFIIWGKLSLSVQNYNVSQSHLANPPICHCEFTRAGSSSAVTARVQYPMRSKSYERWLTPRRDNLEMLDPWMHIQSS